LDSDHEKANRKKEREKQKKEKKEKEKKDKERAKANGGDWQDVRSRLLNVGDKLDEPRSHTSWARSIGGSGETWQLRERDAWIEEHLRIRTKPGAIELMKLNAAQLRYSYDCALNNAKRNIVLKARQVGITTYIAARYFVQTVTKPGTLTMLVSHDRESAEEIFRIVHRFWDNLGKEYQTGPLKTSHASVRELVFPALDSEFTVASADENAGRGRTIQNLHCTEVARWGRNGAEALASLRAAVVPRGEIVLESTANGAWGTFYQEWEAAEETGYRRHFFPWWFEDSYRIETGPRFVWTDEEKELAAAQGLTQDQIYWRRQQWAALRGLAPQEFAEDAVACFRASGECVFDLEIVEKAIAEASDPVELKDNGRLAIWMPERPGKSYVIGVDPAGGGVRGDYSCAEVIERQTGLQCAELHGHLSHKDLAGRLVDLAKRYNSAVLAVERNNHGAGVLAHLERTDYTEIYEEKGWNGWNTTAVSRPALVERLIAVMMERPELFRSARLWTECRTFVRSATGRPEAAHGAHDDCVMAMGIALAVREEDVGRKVHRRDAEIAERTIGG
jgi:hypothetical protein